MVAWSGDHATTEIVKDRGNAVGAF